MAATLLFLPGTLCDARVWGDSIGTLGTEWNCVFVQYRLEESISDMAATALAQAAGPVIPIGLSMGGIVALEIWRQAAARVAALALFDTDPGADKPERRAQRDAQVLCATHGDFRAMVESQLTRAYFSASGSAAPSLRDMVVAMALEQGVGAFAAQATALATRPDSWPLLELIDVPTLVACGDEDRICPPEGHERMASLLPTATLRFIRAAGHLAPLEQPSATTRELRTWLDALHVAAAGAARRPPAPRVE